MDKDTPPRSVWLQRLRGAPGVAVWVFVTFLSGISCAQAQAIGIADADQRLVIETVSVNIVNPSRDPAVNTRVEDAVRRAVQLFPGQRYAEEKLAFVGAIARRNADIADVDYTLLPGPRGGVEIAFRVVLDDGAMTPDGRGYLLSSDPADLPTLYDKGGTYLRFRLDLLSMYYANSDAWFGQPGPMLQGNPLVQGTPAGTGTSGWAEGFVHYGLYGMTPVTETGFLYAGLSAITSGSAGQELFTDLDRSYTAVEDAFVGLVAGRTGEDGDRLVFNLSAGRQRFTLANAFLIANTAGNGGNRAALQSNARWASDLLVLGQVAYNGTKLEAFYLDPDELPVIDTDTRIAGINVEGQVSPSLSLGASYLEVPASDQMYFSPSGDIIGGREGLRLTDLRFTWQPAPIGQTGPFLAGEIARQSNENFAMDATAAYAEAGYELADARWSPTLSYRLSYFSGDDPETLTYERWDPLLSGGNGEQWVQGINNFKIVQDANVIAHRLQARLNLTQKLQLVPQLWAFYADSLNNIGGNPALTYLSDSEYGYEANLTAKWFANRNVYVQGHVALTVPGDAIDAALGGADRDWWSAMVFVRYAF